MRQNKQSFIRVQSEKIPDSRFQIEDCRFSRHQNASLVNSIFSAHFAESFAVQALNRKGRKVAPQRPQTNPREGTLVATISASAEIPAVHGKSSGRKEKNFSQNSRHRTNAFLLRKGG